MTALPLQLTSPAGRGVVLAATLGSGMTMLDGSVVNVALKTIGTDFEASLAQLQWVTNGYLLALAGLILLGGALGDRYGRRRLFVVGVAWFAVASLLCGLAPDVETLIAARVLQGIGGALLVPGSLAMIEAVFVDPDRSRAIGAWSGLGGIAMAIGPFLGGALVEYVNWRWIFLVNVPLAVLTLLCALRWVPETRSTRPGRFDLPGAVLATVTLAAVTGALTDTDLMLPGLVAGVVSGCAFVLVEHRRRDPMVPLGLFSHRVFSSVNVVTLVVYAALGAMTFFLTLQLQTVSGYGALAAGLASLPITICMIFLAARGGELGARIGPRIPMTLGPLLMAIATVLLVGVGAEVVYWRDVLPGVVLFGLGLALLVAPLTATVLAAAPRDNAGIASGINNAVSRTGSLIAIAALPALVGLGAGSYDDPVQFDLGYGRAMWTCAVLLVLGAAASWFLMPRRAGRAGIRDVS